MAIDVAGFIEALGGYMVTALSLSTSPRKLFYNKAREGEVGGVKNAADPYSILSNYPAAALGNVPVPTIAMQIMTTGSDEKAALQAATALFGTLFETTGQAIRNKTLSGFTLKSILRPRPPGIIGRNGKGWVEYASNFDARFVATS